MYSFNLLFSVHLNQEQVIILKDVLYFGNIKSNIILFTNRFIIENVYCLEFNMNINSSDISKVYDRDNIALFAVLRCQNNKDTGIIVANTHLLFNIQRGDVKLGQTLQVMNSLALLEKHYKEEFKSLNSILCGDFNAIPNSGIYKLITEGYVDCTNLDRRNISGQTRGDMKGMNPSSLKADLLKYVTTKFNEVKHQNKQVNQIFI